MFVQMQIIKIIFKLILKQVPRLQNIFCVNCFNDHGIKTTQITKHAYVRASYTINANIEKSILSDKSLNRYRKKYQNLEID